MSETAKRLLEQVLTLPDADRLRIADELWASLSDQSQMDATDATLNDPEFQAELERRLASVADDTAELIDGEQVFREARERLKKRRS
jgi:putative addiction module component (TIGR02574 family)